MGKIFHELLEVLDRVDSGNSVGPLDTGKDTFIVMAGGQADSC